MFWIELNLTSEPQFAANSVEPTAVTRAQVQFDGQSRTVLF
jgi:hypothetical protein